MGVKGPSAGAGQPTCGTLQAVGGGKGFHAAWPWSGGGFARKEQRMGLESDQDGLLTATVSSSGQWVRVAETTQIPLHPCKPFLVHHPTHFGVFSPPTPCTWDPSSKNRSRPLEPLCPHAHRAGSAWGLMSVQGSPQPMTDGGKSSSLLHLRTPSEA